MSSSMSGKKVDVKLKSGTTVQVFDYEVENLKKQGLVAKEEKKTSQSKEEKQSPQTKENKQAANRKTK